MEAGYYKCKECEDGKQIKTFTYKGKEFHYTQTCSECRGKGVIDWIQKATGRVGWFFDNHPPGSMIIDGIYGRHAIYDGTTYVDLSTERGDALYHELCQPDEEENVDE